jgi:hypothetical protein
VVWSSHFVGQSVFYETVCQVKCLHWRR